MSKRMLLQQQEQKNVGAHAAPEDYDDDYFDDEPSGDPQITHIDKPPIDLKTTCSPINVQSKVGYAQCKDKCSPAACCLSFFYDHQPTCLETNEVACGEYDTFCEILNFDHNGDGMVQYQEHVEVPLPPSNLREVCEWDELTTIDGYQQCESACEKGKCCYKSIETCQVTNPEVCEEYDACEILIVQEVLTVPKPLPGLDKICSADSIVETVGFKTCKDACDPGECCREPIETCKVANPDMCREYAECSILSGNPQTHPDAVASQVQLSCTTTNMQTADGVRECQEACNPGLCCIGGADGKGEKCNFIEYAEWCDQYAGCNLLHHVDDGGFTSNKNAKDAVDTACSDFSAAGIEACKNICDPAKCCFKLNEECSESGMGDVKCIHYAPCGHLYVNDQDPNTSTTIHKGVAGQIDFEDENWMDEATAIVELCTAEKLETEDGLNNCMELCQDKLCCFADAEQNCLKSYGSLCMIYAGCQPLDDFIHS
mmetsp:Transcript_36315/g.53078  ORF Transcript_36315/g.53078 Transcript_36315/m.53078 type:complete len:486 (+) Transcript_36315:93-1550(+)